MNTCHIYMRYNKKGKVFFVIQYKFNVSVSSSLVSINTNCTLLALSSSTTVKITESRTDANVKPAMEADATSGKKKLIQKWYKQRIYI